MVCRFPGQSRINPEIRIGGMFNEGTVKALTSGVKTKFASLFFEGGGFEPGEDVEEGMKTLLELTDPQREAERVHKVLGLEEGEVAEGFFFSSLPRLYNESDDPRINPFNYVEIVDERDWLRVT